MAEDIFGYYDGQIIRKSVGSPVEWFAFESITNSIMIDNISSSGTSFFAFGSNASYTTSGCGIIKAGNARIFDIRVGSIALQGSGTDVLEMQVVRLS